jgi:hypothetical protein
MDRLKHLNHFYEILMELQSKTGTRTLATSNIYMEWPQQGVYFFFESGEMRDNGKQMRVVRVGVSKYSESPQSPLWDRLREHRGTISGKFSGGGNHRISNFRYHVGGALINRDNLVCPTWEKLDITNTSIRKKEHALEKKVSDIISNMPFLWISTDRSLRPDQLNQFIKRNAVALLSNYNAEITLDRPSPAWLGHYSPNESISLSGLWNYRNVDVVFNPKFLDYLEKLVRLVK